MNLSYLEANVKHVTSLGQGTKKVSRIHAAQDEQPWEWTPTLCLSVDLRTTIVKEKITEQIQYNFIYVKLKITLSQQII